MVKKEKIINNKKTLNIIFYKNTSNFYKNNCKKYRKQEKTTQIK